MSRDADRRPGARASDSGNAFSRAGADPRRGRWILCLQAAIAVCHACAPTAEDTDWRTIVGLYSKLSALTGSPVMELNRAVAVAMLEGPAAGLQIVQALEDSPALKGYHMLPSVRGNLLQRLGRPAEARAAFTAAAGLRLVLPERPLATTPGRRRRRGGTFVHCVGRAGVNSVAEERAAPIAGREGKESPDDVHGPGRAAQPRRGVPSRSLSADRVRQRGSRRRVTIRERRQVLEP